MKNLLDILINKNIKNRKNNSPSFVFKNSRIVINDPIPNFTELKIGSWTSSSTPINIHAYHTSNLNLNIRKFVHIGKNFKWIASKEHTPEFISNQLNALFLNEEEFQKIYSKYHRDSPSLEIGNDVWIGDNVIIIGTIKIDNGAVVGAGSVITHDIKAFEIVAGNPQRHIRYRFNKKEIVKLERLKWWDWNDKKIKTNINKFFTDKLLK